MSHAQRHVSTELSHFVGRGRTDEEQYSILLKILKTGLLAHSPHDPSLQRTANLDLSKPISEDKAIRAQVVCFCDIPERFVGASLRIGVGRAVSNAQLVVGLGK
jgi:hypothetical protein